MDLKIAECQGKCDWKRSQVDGVACDRGGEPLFACQACGSEWVPSAGWTPKNADGSISSDVLAAKPGPDPEAGGGVGSW